MAIVDDVYSLVASRELSSCLRIHELAQVALGKAEGAELLALHEAIVDALDGLLTELAEHGRDNAALIDVDPAELDLQALVASCASSWQEASRLREAGVDSEPLIVSYVGDWMDPVGSPGWRANMRAGVKHRSDPAWADRIAARIKGA